MQQEMSSRKDNFEDKIIILNLKMSENSIRSMN